jgi:hypothetical protein
VVSSSDGRGNQIRRRRRAIPIAIQSQIRRDWVSQRSERGMIWRIQERSSGANYSFVTTGGYSVGDSRRTLERLYFRCMPQTRSVLRKLFPFVAAILVGECLLAASAAGQSTPADLSTDCSAYASVSLPAEAKSATVPKTAPACASYRSYRGIGRPVNYAEARACAWQERLAQEADLGQNQQEPTAWVVGGSLILADMYFNGAGVKRNVPLAMRLACESEEQMGRLALEELAKLPSLNDAKKPFEFCDYAVTTFTMNFCFSYSNEIGDEEIKRYYKSLELSMNTEQKTAFEKLLAARDAYVKEHALEVDQGGTIRSIRTMGSQNILGNLFHTDVVRFERKKWPELSERQIARADSSMQSEYEKTLLRLKARPKDETYQGAVTAENLAKVQESWKAYREAWVAFARLRYPPAIDAIRAEITLERYRLLKTI